MSKPFRMPLKWQNWIKRSVKTEKLIQKALNPQAQVSGGFQIGASGNGQNTQTTQEQLDAAFGV